MGEGWKKIFGKKREKQKRRKKEEVQIEIESKASVVIIVIIKLYEQRDFSVQVCAATQYHFTTSFD